ncbi:ATP-binding protein [Neosynechococcus sphagnicola]|uniref:ATP-binding protein n=1 Tax=Neosynechococcus sphagnicola TaxID=1501145 RepID=UPI0019553276|nr:ATP-binding protein [Neosynechococcus sphagnicola]
MNQPPITDKRIWWQCQTVFKEAFDNVIDHAHKDLPLDTPIEIEAVRTVHQIELRIWDFGPPL